MIPKQAIEKAIEGGWKGPPRPNTFYDYSYEAILARQTGGVWSLNLEAALDPTFWQALGKALGWEDYHSDRNMVEKIDTLTFANGTVFGWQAVSHRFYDLTLTGGDIEKFWADLLTQ